MNLASNLSDEPTIPQQLPLTSTGEAGSNQEAILECATWLNFHRIWGQLNEEMILALARSLQHIKVESNTEIYRQGLKPMGLYLLKWGTVEIYRCQYTQCFFSTTV